MPRLRQVSRAEATDTVRAYYDKMFGDRDPVVTPGTSSGSPGDWWTVYALNPYVFDHLIGLFGMVGAFVDKAQSTLEPKIKELGIIRAGFVTGSQFVYSQHCKAGRRNGLSPEQVAAIPTWTVSDLFSPEERAVLAFADCLALQQGRTPDAIFEAVKAVLPDESILEFAYIVCSYVTMATISKALKLEFDDVDDRVAEVPMPEPGKLVSEWRR